jgi:hypothetical protein
MRKHQLFSTNLPAISLQLTVMETKIRVGTREALTMNGRLDIDEGDYAFLFNP